MGTRILIFGDSIVQGACDDQGGWAARLNADAQRLAMDSDDYDSVYPLGISGNNSDDLLRRFESELEARVDEETDLVVLLAIGVNDSQYFVSNGENRVSLTSFRSNLSKLLSISQKYDAMLHLVGLTPVDEALMQPVPWDDDKAYSNNQIAEFDTALQDFARLHELLFVDILKEFLSNDYTSLLEDGLHPNTEGHAMMHRRILNELQNVGLLKQG